jgi:tetratricopeptide (TPR) repeat protein
VLTDAALVLACFGEDILAMIALVDRALAFNPSYARAWHVSGLLRLWAGQPDIAIEHANRALRFSPRAEADQTSYLVGIALFFSRRFEEAVPRLRAITPEVMVNCPLPFRDAQHRELHLLGLRLAMGEAQ